MSIEAQLLRRCEQERDEYIKHAAALRRRIRDALTHYAIGQAAASDFLPVAWSYVAEQMAAALRPDRSEPA